MNVHTYNLRSRLNSPATVKSPITTPTLRTTSKTVRRIHRSPVVLELENVIGTTTKYSAGLSACLETDSFAYCAGSVAVLAQVETDGSVSRRFFRAKPTVQPINFSIPYYDTPTSTPTKKRPLPLTPRKAHDYSTPRGTPYYDEETTKTWTARERIKTITSVSLSANGKFLAVGETGYNPRVLIFSTIRDASTEAPLSIITDHTWGVRSVAFSPDSKYLATLGEVNDGYLFLWSIQPKTGAIRLLASNKCTTNICHMAWCGDRLITVGTRHVKIWQIPSSKDSPGKQSRLRDALGPLSANGPVPLTGRNCLLGNMVNCTFTCIVSISEQYALICADTNELCLVDVNKAPAELAPVQAGIRLAGAMAYRRSTHRLVWAGGGHELEEIDIFNIITKPAFVDIGSLQRDATSSIAPRAAKRSILRQSLGITSAQPQGIIAMECLQNHTITIDADANLTIRSIRGNTGVFIAKSSSSHNQCVQGVQTLPLSAGLGTFFTWSKAGEVRFWDHEAELLKVKHIELDDTLDTDDNASNELKVLRYSEQGVFICGDRYGVLKVVDSERWQCTYTARAHGAEVNDICLGGTDPFVATCSRDRMVQLFLLNKHALDHVQTTDDHIAAVTQLLFNSDGEVLLSCSADRTIVVREKATRGDGPNALVAFLQVRIITIKAAPLSMCFPPDSAGVLYVSALDRHVTKIDYTTGSTLASFKVTDTENEDTAVLSSIQIAIQHELLNVKSYLLGCSSTDKSVRIYDLDKHILLARESAHTEGVTDLALLPNADADTTLPRRRFVSTGQDSTVMLWTVLPSTIVASPPTTEFSEDQIPIEADSSPVKPSPATLPPLRRVLSKIDIADFVRAPSSRVPSREPSPARPMLVRKSSRLALAPPVIKELEEPPVPALRRRASADDRATIQPRSPSPPPYVTKRPKKQISRPEIGKDFFQRQADWLHRSPDPMDTTKASVIKIEEKANKARLRRPPSVPADLRAKAMEPARKAGVASTISTSGDPASDQTYRIMKSYRRRLETSKEETVSDEFEQELHALLDTIKSRKTTKRHNTDRPRRTGISTRSKTTSTSDSDGTNNTNVRPSITTLRTKSAPTNSCSSSSHTIQSVEGLSVLLERTNLG